jgi:hypothetical protein
MRQKHFSTIKIRALLFVVPFACAFLVSGCATDGVPGQGAAPERRVQVSSMRPSKGSSVLCRAAKGSGYFGGVWRDFAPFEFTLKDGDKTRIALSSRKGGEKAEMLGFLDIAGQNILFCPLVAAGAPEQKVPCASLYALEDDYAAGFKRTFDVPKAVIGATITCAFSAASLKKI